MNRIPTTTAMRELTQELGAMKLSKLIDYLKQVYDREGDIPVVNKDGQPFTFVDVEQLDGKPLYKVVTKP